MTPRSAFRTAGFRIGLSVLALVTIGAPGVAGPQPVSFNVSSSASQYDVGEQIVLTLELENTGSEAVTVSAYDVGTLRASLKRDGRSVRPLRTIVFFSEDPRLVQAERLVTLDPGELVEIPFDVYLDPRFASALRDVQLPRRPGAKRDRARSRVFPLEGPGVYELRFAYRYGGPDEGFPNVLHTRLRSNEISFTLVDPNAGP